MSRTNGQLLEEALSDAIAIGEMPYRANRDAVRYLNILNRAPEGREKLNDVLAGIDNFIRALGRVRDVSEVIVRNASSVLR